VGLSSWCSVAQWLGSVKHLRDVHCLPACESTINLGSSAAPVLGQSSLQIKLDIHEKEAAFGKVSIQGGLTCDTQSLGSYYLLALGPYLGLQLACALDHVRDLNVLAGCGIDEVRWRRCISRSLTSRSPPAGPTRPRAPPSRHPSIAPYVHTTLCQFTALLPKKNGKAKIKMHSATLLALLAILLKAAGVSCRVFCDGMAT
jgi:hypothetical protein